MNRSKRFLYVLLLVSQALLINACSDSDDDDPETGDTEVSLPEGLHLSLLNSSTAAYYSFDTTSEELQDLNELAQSSEESAVKNLLVTDTSTIGHFLHWHDFRVVNEEERFDTKYVLMRPEYQSGSSIDADQFVQLAHFHGDVLAAHSAEEFRDPEAGSNKEAGLLRLNNYVTEHQELHNEISEVMPDGEQLCRAFIDPYIKFEMSEEGEHEHEGEGEHETEGEHEHEDEHEHEHGELIHFALSDSGRIYFFEEGESGLEEMQGFVTLDNVTTISNCDTTSIARVSEDGILIFIPDTQMLYLVDSHGSDFHQHSTWNISSILPEGVRADLIAFINTGEGDHEHNH